MKKTRVENFLELHNVLSKYKRNNQWIFRGQSDIKWSLVPKVGRKPYNKCSDLDFLRLGKGRLKNLLI